MHLWHEQVTHHIYCQVINILGTMPLAQVSHAVSGLNGINFSNFEDAMATRYAPREIDIDTYFTRNSDNDQLRDAIAEITRYGLLGDHSLLTMLHSHDDIKELRGSDGLIRLLSKAVQSRVELSENSDPMHKRSLNFGKIMGDTIMHVTKGRAKYYEAITSGMLVELFLGERSGISGRGAREKIGSVMDQYGMKKANIREIGIDNILKSLNERYNIENHNLKFIVPEELGKPAAFEMSSDRITNALRAFTEQYEFNPVV